MMHSPIGKVSDTAFWVAHYRGGLSKKNVSGIRAAISAGNYAVLGRDAHIKSTPP